MPFWLPNGTDPAAPDRGRGPASSCASAATRRSSTPQVLDEELWHRSGHWDNYRENMYFTRVRASAQLRAAADELPRRLPRLRRRAPLLPRAAAAPRRVRPASRATSARASCTACCGCAPSPRTTPTSTAPPEQIADEVDRHLRGDRRALRALRLRGRAGRALDPAGEVDRHRRAVGAGRGGAARGARAPGPRVRAQPRRRRLLRAEDRLPRHRRARPLLAVRHLPARLLHARALRPHLHRRRRRAAPPGDDPPRPARLDGALRRDPDRALRRPLPGLAGAGAGDRPAGRRPPRRLRRAASPAELREAGVRVEVDDALGVGRQEDPRRRARPLPLHAGRRRPRAGGRARSRCAPTSEGELGAMRRRVRAAFAPSESPSTVDAASVYTPAT